MSRSEPRSCSPASRCRPSGCFATISTGTRAIRGRCSVFAKAWSSRARTSDAAWVQQAFDEAWKNADVRLRSSRSDRGARSLQLARARSGQAIGPGWIADECSIRGDCPDPGARRHRTRFDAGAASARNGQPMRRQPRHANRRCGAPRCGASRLVPIGSARLGDNPSGSDTFPVDAVVPCRFKPGGVGGNTPKFDCELESGEKVRVKYGRDNPEVFAEVIATRLLSALGFADRPDVCDRTRPLLRLPGGSVLEPAVPERWVDLREMLSRPSTFPSARDFETAVIERQIAGPAHRDPQGSGLDLGRARRKSTRRPAALRARTSTRFA